MSLSITHALRRAVATPSTSRRLLSSTVVRASSHMVDPEKAAEELEAGKQSNLKGQTKGDSQNPGWNEKIASESEAIVKATKNDASPEQLQKETVDRVQQTSNDGNTTVTHEHTEKTTVKKAA